MSRPSSSTPIGLTLPTGVAFTTAPTLSVKEGSMSVEASIPAWTVTLPAGRFLLRSIVKSTPARGGYGPPITATLDTGVVTAGASATCPATKPYHAIKDFENGGAGNVLAKVDIDKWDGTRWRPFTGRTLTKAYAAPPAASTAKLFGSNLHLLGGYTEASTGAIVSRSPTDWNYTLDAAQDLGLDFVRTSMPWCYFETARGTRDANIVAMIDAFFAACVARGLKVLALAASGPPGWSSTRSSTAFTWKYLPYPGWACNSSVVDGGWGPDSWADFENHLTWFVNRYASQNLYAVETLNEPLIGSTYTRSGSGSSNWTCTPAEIVNYHTHAWTAIKAAQPTVKVIGGVMPSADDVLLQHFYDSGVVGHYDAISVHPYKIRFTSQGAVTGQPGCYNPRSPMEDEIVDDDYVCGTERLLDTMTANGDAAPLWITETGWATGVDPTSGLCVSEAQQAEYLPIMLRQLARIPQVEAVSFHSLEDKGAGYSTSSVHASMANFGVVRTDFRSRKPSYAAVKSAIASIRAGTG